MAQFEEANDNCTPSFERHAVNFLSYEIEREANILLLFTENNATKECDTLGQIIMRYENQRVFIFNFLITVMVREISTFQYLRHIAST